MEITTFAKVFIRMYHIICGFASLFIMDRHTQNYGVLRDRAAGSIIGMAPNFDNNIALISRGYGSDARQTNGFLIDLFVDLCGTLQGGRFLASKVFAFRRPPSRIFAAWTTGLPYMA